MRARNLPHRVPDKGPGQRPAKERMSETNRKSDTPPAPERRRRRMLGPWMVLSLILAAAIGGFGWLSLSGQVLTAPRWLSERVTEQINERMPGGHVTLGRLQLRLDDTGLPHVTLNNFGIYDAGGAEVARLNNVETRFSGAALLLGRIEPVSVDFAGAQMTLRRRGDGQFDISFGGATPTTGTLTGVLDQMDAVFQQPALARLKKLAARELTITIEDARSGRLWQVTDGTMQLRRNTDGLDLSVNFDVFNQTEELAETIIGVRTRSDSARASIGTTFKNAAARDLALQSPVLSFLGVLDAPISGALRAEFDDVGALESLAGTLEIGEGALQPTPQIKPVRFNSAKSYFEYEPEARRLVFSEVNVASETASVTARGHAYLRDFADGWPSTFLGQFSFSNIKAHPRDFYDEPIAFSQGAADIRIGLQPFSIDIGQFVLGQGDEKLIARGRVLAGDTGWEVATDLSINQMADDRLLSLWPVSVIPRTRQWLDANIRSAVLSDIRGAIRIRPGKDPVLALGWNFSDTKVRYIKTQPEIQNASGYASIDGNALTLNVEQGHVDPPEGGAIDMGGTVFRIPDLRARPAVAEVRLKGSASTTAVLSLLNEPPFKVLRTAGFGPSVASGRATFSADITFPLLNKLGTNDVTYSATGVLENVFSAKLVPGYALSAGRLDLRVDNSGVEIAGPLQIGAVPADILWRQDFGPEHAGKSRVTGSIELSPAFVETFNIGLPDGAVTGRGDGQFQIDLEQGVAPRFSLFSDLNRVGLRVDAIGWHKPRNVTGKLAMNGRLGARPSVDLLELQAAGLRLDGGRVTVGKDGGLETASFARLRVGGWLDAPVSLRGRGPGLAPEVTVSGGTLDIRKTSFATGATSSATGAGRGMGQGGPVLLNLDQVIVSEGMRLTGFNGTFSTKGGFAGKFTARMNGKTPLNGRLAPEKNGTAIKITSKNAGGVMRSAGIVEYANKGEMNLTLRPLKAPGQYRGVMNIKNTKVVNAPGLTDLLSAISIVGLLDQLGGEGISFDRVEATFRLTPDAVYLEKSSAVGPSLGISLDGVYDLARGTMNMQGVISPVWFLNGIGQLFSKRGEGLFGFTFTLTGTNENPSVKVNPLSILTPGAFRDIFRAPPPKAQK